MRAILFVLAALVVSQSSAQDFKKHIKPYTSLVVARGVDARLVQSPAMDITLTTHGVDPSDVIVENRGDELRIKVATKALWQEMQDNHWWVRVEVPYQELKSVEALTGARVRNTAPVQVEVLDLAASMGGSLEMNVEVKDLLVATDMGAMAEIDGKAKSLRVTASMGSNIDLGSLEADYVKAKSSMGSNLEVRALVEFDGTATMGGIISVKGHPERFYENTGMGGEITGGKSN